MRESRKMVKGVQLGSEVRLRYLRLSYQSVSQRLPAIIARACCFQSHTILFSVLQPSPFDKSKTKVTAVFTQPLAQITSYKLWPAGCITLSLRVNDLAGCRLAGGGETECERQRGRWTQIKFKKSAKKCKKEMAQQLCMQKLIRVLNLWPTHTTLLSYCLWQCFPLMNLHTKHQGSILHTVAGFQ